NHLAEIDGDTAHAETYCLAAMRRRDGDAFELVGARYLDRFERRDGRWAIAARVVIFESALDPAIAGAFAAACVPGTQDKSDPSYQRPLRVARPPRNDIPSS